MDKPITLVELEKILDDCERKLMKKVADEADRIQKNKENLRLVLIEEGYPIPEGLTLDEWIPYIRGEST